MSAEQITLEDVRAEAKKKLKGWCMVYKDCDGGGDRFCQGQQYGRRLGIGGAGSGASFHNNWLALRALRLRMDLVSEHMEPDTTYEFLGKTLSMPIMAAPVSGVDSFGGEDVISEADFCRAVVQGSNAAGTLGWRGDSFMYSPQESYGLDAINEGGRGGVKIVKPRAQEDILGFFKKAESCNVTAVGVDVDGCGSYAMRTHDKKVYRKTPEEIRELVESTALPVVIKGIMTVEDAVSAADAGVKVVVVSNHGGRVLDHTPGTAEVLPGIVEALKERGVRVLVDGGVRTGYDVLKMLALGAEAVLVGRDIVRAAVGGGAEGVRLQMAYLQKTLVKALLMTRCRSLADVSERVLDVTAAPQAS